MGGACGTEGRQVRCIQGFWWGDLRERDNLEDRRRSRDNIKMDLQDVGWRNMDWTDLAKGRDRWPALLDAVMNLWVL
jgi:hypothetical protein